MVARAAVTESLWDQGNARTSTSSCFHSSCKRLSRNFFLRFPFLLECQDGRTGAELSVRPARFRSVPERTASSFFRCCGSRNSQHSTFS